MKKYKTKPYIVSAWIFPAIEVLRPRERLPVSQWAESNRVLDGLSAAMPGPWRNSTTPYLVEIMDTFSGDEIEKTVFVKPTQVGGTTAMENMLGSLIDQDPGPCMVVYPSDALAKTTAEYRLEPMILKCPVLAAKYRQHESSVLEMKFTDMFISLTGANSEADLSSKPIRYLFLDEVDKYQGASKKEADPVSLAIERTKSYLHRKRIFMASTPTLKTGHIWRHKEAADVEKHYFVPCPHCGEYIELKFAQIKWPSKDEIPEPADRAEKAVYACQACGCVITDRDKGKMLRAGRWQVVRQNTQRPKSVAFWINTLYSPFTRFSEIAKAFMDSKDDPELLHNFTNSWLAEPWEETKLKTSADLVMDRQAELEPYIVPEWAKLLTGGVDVQENCLYWTIRAWGDFLTSQNIAHGQAYSLAEIEQIMNAEYHREDGGVMLVDLALIDSGDQTDAIYDFCTLNTEWALPCKGTGSKDTHYRLSTVNKSGSKAYGMTLVLVDGGKYKKMIAGRMRKENGKGSWMVHKGCDMDYAQQVTSEHEVTERASNGRVTTKWEKKTSRADNHYLDAEVYCMCAADVQGVRWRYLGSTPEGDEKPREKVVTQDDEWIKLNEDWLGAD